MAVINGVLKVDLAELAHTTGYDKGHLSRVLRGMATPSVDCLGWIATALGMTMDQVKQYINCGKVAIKK